MCPAQYLMALGWLKQFTVVIVHWRLWSLTNRATSMSRSCITLTFSRVSFSLYFHLASSLSEWSSFSHRYFAHTAVGIHLFSTIHSSETPRAMPHGPSLEWPFRFDEWIWWDCTRLIEREWKNSSTVYVWWRSKYHIDSLLSVMKSFT